MRRNLFPLIVLAGIICLTASILLAAPPKPQVSNSSPQFVPPGDLVASIEIEAHSENNGCVVYFPKWTIRNKGSKPSGEFSSLLEFKSPGKDWKPVLKPTSSLGPNSKETRTDSISIPYDDRRDCGEAGQFGFRITIDFKKEVPEINENNNMATALSAPLMRKPAGVKKK